MGFLDGLFKPDIAKLEAKRDVEGLIKALGDTRRELHVPAIEALGRIGDARAVKPLIAALGDGNDVVCRAAAEALGKIGAPAVGRLIAALGDRNDATHWPLSRHWARSVRRPWSSSSPLSVTATSARPQPRR